MPAAGHAGPSGNRFRGQLEVVVLKAAVAPSNGLGTPRKGFIIKP